MFIDITKHRDVVIWEYIFLYNVLNILTCHNKTKRTSPITLLHVFYLNLMAFSNTTIIVFVNILTGNSSLCWSKQTRYTLTMISIITLMYVNK